MEDPIWTIGPSRPTEPPVPIVRAEATDLTTITRARIRPPFSATASITSGTPWPLASLASHWVSPQAPINPIAGSRSRIGHESDAAPSRRDPSPNESWVTTWSSFRKPIAPKPVPAPTRERGTEHTHSLPKEITHPSPGSEEPRA